ncbi:hypothetical protein, conserved [Babesia bigemina]|uniref:C3H1-type domain-containing protein n=1 Tax=Babesia bigemina TaxID=5866 RepID=A0A061BLJ0_BABBI|nr:hypothetical protein, conserved [Babesia bigemina]CDR71741.1 hypothetical protein, conserved [Babesia bigemina]|eukprot:XP_012770686.1 hypothetical protein, conserved [Babesia bigemina]
MAFLYGVLDAVKNENEVTTYDSYISDNNNRLESVLKLVDSKIGSGRTGLAVSVGAVREWLEGYEREINDKTKKVTDELTWLINNLNGNYKNKINENSSLTDQLSAWSEVIGNIDFDVTKIEEEKISKLDKALKEKVMHKVDTVKRSVKMLKESAKSGDVMDYARRVDESLEAEEKEIVKKIDTQCECVKDRLHSEFYNIDQRVTALKKTKDGHIEHIQNLISGAQQEIQTLENRINEHYKAELERKFEILDLEMAKIKAAPGIQTAAERSRLHKEIDDIKKAAQGMRKELEMELINVKKTVAGAVNGSGSDGLIQRIKSAVIGLKKNIEDDLKSLKNKIDGAMKEYVKGYINAVSEKVKEIKGHVGDIGKPFNDEARKSIDFNWNILRAQTNRRLSEMYEKKAGKNSGHLGGLLDKVREYAKGLGLKLKQDKGTIDTWLNRVLTDNAAVNNYISSYLRFNETTHGRSFNPQYNGRQSGAESVKEAIRTKLMYELKNISVAGPSGDGSKMEDILQEISEMFQNVAKQIDTTESNKAELIITKIEGDLGVSSFTSNSDYQTYKGYLTWAIRTTLLQVSLIAKQIGEEIKAVLQDSNIQESVDEAIKKINSIKEQLDLDGSEQKHGKQMQKALDTVKTSIDQLQNDFHKSRQDTTSSTYVAGSNTVNVGDGVKSTIENILNGKIGPDSKIMFDDIMTNYNANTTEKSNLQTSITAIETTVKRAMQQDKDEINTHQLNSYDEEHRKYASGVSALEHTVEHLETLPQKVAIARQAAMKNIDALNNEVSAIRTIMAKYVEPSVTTASLELDKTIETFQTLLHEVHENARGGVSQMKKTLHHKVQSTFTMITNQVRTLFSDAHKADLAALKTLVEGQKEEIEKIIRSAKITGVMGLIRKMHTNKSDFEQISEFVTPVKLKAVPTKEDFTGMSSHFRKIVDSVLEYTEYQVSTSSGDPHKRLPTDQSEKVRHLKDAFDALLHYLKQNGDSTRQYLFDHHFDDLLASLNSLVTSLSPTFTSPSPLLAPLKSGLSNFAQQLGLAYVSRYSGVKRSDDWVVPDDSKPKDAAEKPETPKTVLTPEGRNCAKVCLTIVEILNDGFGRLRKYCSTTGGYSKSNICLEMDHKNGQKTKNQLGSWLQSRGFSIPADKDTQNGELNRNVTGAKIIEYMTKKSTQPPNSKGIYDEADKPDGPLWQLVSHLGTYYKVCNYKHIEKPKAPLNVYQMLQWLAGLWYNPVLYPLFKCFKELFPKLKEDEGKDYSEIDRDRLKLEAYPSTVKYTDSASILYQVCFQAKNTLVAILGNGHAGGRYAVDFNTNEDNLDYGSSPNACFDMLADVSFRVYQQSHFLQKQCYNGTKSGGWEDCHYGRHVGGSSWICNEDQCANQNCDQTRKQIADQKTNQNANQTGSQKCNQHPVCGVKSPLQSYLEDGLQKFLPHHLTKVGCGVKCSVGNHFGKPCLTPMGFTDIGILASHTQTGAYIKRAFHDLCGDSDKPLSKLCSLLTCLLRRPPQTLGDMFAFYHQFLSNFDNKHKGVAFKVAVQKANFGIPTTELDVTSIQKSSNHENADVIASSRPVSTHLKGDLFALSSCNPKDAPCLPCGRYLQPLYLNMRNIFVDKHADTYLSWVVYITETFYDLLKKLYDECDARCGGEKPKCRISKCGDACGTKRNPGAHGVNHDSECKSIVKCPDTHPALYRYGFTFGSPNDLSGVSGVGKQRTCHDFCEALKTVVKEDNLLFKLVNKLIPEYIFAIRAPFIWLNVALWLLSFLYLLHIMVIRLDILHIKSHLHSPSSHRIAAQSLLAAGRVNKLNRVFYLQP